MDAELMQEISVFKCDDGAYLLCTQPDNFIQSAGDYEDTVIGVPCEEPAPMIKELLEACDLGYRMPEEGDIVCVNTGKDMFGYISQWYKII